MSRPLDRHDLQILRTLQTDGRVTKVKLAESVNLSPSPCWQRQKRLESEGVISGYRAEIDLRRLGPVTEVIVQVALASHRAADFRRFEDAVKRAPEVTTCDATGGGTDYIMRLVVRDVDAYQRFMDELLEAGLGIDRYWGHIVTKPVKDAPPDIAGVVTPAD